MVFVCNLISSLECEDKKKDSQPFYSDGCCMELVQIDINNYCLTTIVLCYCVIVIKKISLGDD
eukprot:m.13074 g.13074  ORF g.13074 m.13074 type:complete len:63 (+) comp4104_c0_seq1:382-570(+)